MRLPRFTVAVTVAGVVPEGGETESQFPAEKAETLKLTEPELLATTTMFCGGAEPVPVFTLNVS